jgi:hypothetical protein
MGDPLHLRQVTTAYQPLIGAFEAHCDTRTIDRGNLRYNPIEQAARKVIVGTAAFGASGANVPFLEALCDAIGRERVIIALDSKDGRIVIKGWRESTNLTAESVIEALEPYCSGFLCTYVDKEGITGVRLTTSGPLASPFVAMSCAGFCLAAI